MGRTQLTSREIGSVQRNDFDIVTTGQSVITKVIAGTNITFSSTGVDAGTGDVTINSSSGGGDMILASIQTVTGAKTFGGVGGVGKFILAGNTSGTTVLNAAAIAGAGTITLPTGTDTLAGLGTVQTFTALNTFLGTTTSDGPTFSSDINTTAGSGTNWTGNLSAGALHATGSTVAFTGTVAASVSTMYQLVITISGRLAGTIDISFGGVNNQGYSSTVTLGLKAATTGTLIVTPSSLFDGTVAITIKVSTASTSSFNIANSTGSSPIEFRASSTVSNMFGGSLSGNQTFSTSLNNTAYGYRAMSDNTSGSGNTVIGADALRLNQSGNNNIAIGNVSLGSNTLGSGNIGNGYNSLLNNTIGSYNVAIGQLALQNNTIGNFNTATGRDSLSNNISGSENLSNGYLSGKFISGGVTSATISNNSVFLGARTYPLADNQTNQTVIGYNAVGLGSNTTVIGNSSSTFGRFWGRLLVGTSVDDGTSILQIRGTTASDGPTLGAETAAVTATATNWTLAGTNLNVGGYTHAVTSTVPFVTGLAAVSSTYYQITYTITRTTGSVNITYGGASINGVTASGAAGILTNSTAVLTLTPTTDFDGTVILSIVTIGLSTATAVFSNSSGSSAFELRAGTNVTNQFIGTGVGRRCTTGINNTGNGANCLFNITSGGNNSAIGFTAMQLTTTGGNNNAFGSGTLQNNIIGSGNTAIGNNALNGSLVDNNTAIGNSASLANTTGSLNLSGGAAALRNNTTGSENVGLGNIAGRYIADGVTNATIIDNSVLIGSQTKVLADNQTNQIVIGYNATGLGSNTIAIGNTSSTFGRFWGRLLVGSSVDDGSNSLQIAGNARSYAYDINQVIDPTVPTASVSAGGSVDTGDHWYAVTYTTAVGETHSIFTAAVVTTTAGNNTVTLNIPISSDSRVTGRKIYRSKLASVFQFADFFVGTVANNTSTSYVDTVADSTLVGIVSASYFRANTTTPQISINGSKVMVLDSKLTIVGSGAGVSLTSGGRDTFIGVSAGGVVTSGSDNTYVGYSAGGFYSSTGGSNVGVGSYASASVTTGSFNTALGYAALQSNSTASSSTAVGRQSLSIATLSNNTAVGHFSGNIIAAGTQNTFLGSEAGNVVGQLATASNSMALGYQAYTTASNQIIIGNTSIVNVGIGILGSATSALLHLKAGTATAGTAPFKLTSGTVLGTTEAGAVEYDGTHLYFTATAAGTRFQLDQQSSGGITRSINNISTTTTGSFATSIDYVYLMTSTFTYTQPTAVSNTNQYTLKNAGVGIITINFTSGQTGDGSTSITLRANSSIDLISNNTNWLVI